jgi:hypothetical protein
MHPVLTPERALDDLRQAAAAQGLGLSIPLQDVLRHVEFLAHDLGLDPYRSFWLLGLLSRGPRFRSAVTALRGDPDEAARFIRGTLEAYPESYAEGSSWNEPGDRHDLLERAMAYAREEGNQEVQEIDFARALLDQELADAESLTDWSDPRMRTKRVMLAHLADQYDESLAIDVADVLRLLTATN